MVLLRLRVVVASTLVLTLLAGCMGGSGPGPTTSSGSETAPNPCTGLPQPSVGRDDDDTFRGENAMAYVVGLVCDHSGATPRERPRVPGTQEHTDAREWLVDAVEENGFQASTQQFSGEEYETLMQDHASSSFAYWFNNCKPEDRQRLRSLDFSNVIGRGGNLNGPIVLLMAHYDSKRFASDAKEPVLGANDGASGVGVLLELARTIQTTETTMEIRIFLTDGEDGFEDCHPLAGSMFYANHLSQTDRTRIGQGAIILLDMVGDAQTSFYKGCGSDDQLADTIWQTAKDLDVPQFRTDGSCSVVDDHTPFEESGFHAVDIVAFPPFPPYWHTTKDAPDQLEEDMLGDVGRILQSVIGQLEADVLPIPS